MPITDNWVPEILYEESDDSDVSALPFIMVPPGKEMPSMLYVFESRDTGEFEPGLEGESVPVVQWDLHQYADMVILKDGLSEEAYDDVRAVLGLEPLETASQKGQKITQKIREKIEL
tara:strand:+ start:1486 stop:1836 length:351 start_codon:yes stop_codon:yes gene_type:complete